MSAPRLDSRGALDFLLAQDGLTRGDLQTQRGLLPAMLKDDGILPSEDLTRVAGLPRREGTPPELIAAMSRALCTEPGPMLREPQATFLRELYQMGGAFAPMRVGSGKTLATLLAPTLLGAERPVLILPAAMFRKSPKTQRDFATYRAAGWRVRLPTLVSYEELGRADREHYLLKYRPDLLMLDEGHMARNLAAACTRRIRRCVEWVQPRPRVAVLSGTLITDALMDYWHLLVWALGPSAPVPMVQAEAERWARALDRTVGSLKRINVGALADLPGGFHEWMRESRGVVPTPGSDCDASIEIRAWVPQTPEPLAEVIRDTEVSAMRPDGELLDEWELPDCLCQLALGFYYRWDPMPPDWWLNPRRAWRAYVRGILDEQIVGFDSESQIVAALDREVAPPPAGDWVFSYNETQQQVLTQATPEPPAAAEGRHLLAAWRGVRDGFEPNPVPVWLDRSILQQATQRAGAHCLIWTRYRAVGHALQELGVPYFGGGADPEAAPPGRTIACSIAAHHKGRNLQAWHRALVLTPMANPDMWEQLIGREHRAGQTADAVEVDVIQSIAYHGAVMERVTNRARHASRASGFAHKLLDATWL